MILYFVKIECSIGIHAYSVSVEELEAEERNTCYFIPSRSRDRLVYKDRPFSISYTSTRVKAKGYALSKDEVPSMKAKLLAGIQNEHKDKLLIVDKMSKAIVGLEEFINRK